jgi:hypothetical protein
MVLLTEAVWASVLSSDAKAALDACRAGAAGCWTGR